MKIKTKHTSLTLHEWGVSAISLTSNDPEKGRGYNTIMAIQTSSNYALIMTNANGMMNFHITRNGKRITIDFINFAKAQIVFNHYAHK